MKNRIESIDGLRGVAITLVILFHTFYHSISLTPWLSGLENVWVVKYGFLGVELFFLISGFLIYKSIENCKSLGEFLLKRWLRLFPAMLLATILIFSTSYFLSERPNGIPKLVDCLPGLLFIHPYFFEKFFTIKTVPIEWAYWSLFVEVIFYVIFGISYFTNKKNAPNALLILFLLSILYRLLEFLNLANILLIKKLVDGSFIYFGWFYVGCIQYRDQKENIEKINIKSLIILVLSSIATVGLNWKGIIFCLLIYLIFCNWTSNTKKNLFINNPVFVNLGVISYPLYLIHENAILALSIKTQYFFPDMWNYVNPIPGLITILLTAIVITRFCEPAIKKLIVRLLGFIKTDLAHEKHTS